MLQIHFAGRPRTFQFKPSTMREFEQADGSNFKDPESVARYLAGIGESTELPARSPNRGSPYWKSIVLRRQALGYEDT